MKGFVSLSIRDVKSFTSYNLYDVNYQQGWKVEIQNCTTYRRSDYLLA